MLEKDNMEIKDLLEKIDNLIRESKLSEAEKLMKDELKKSKEEKNLSKSVTLLNELTGFYRDMGRMVKSIDCCLEAEQLLDEMGIGKTKERAASYLNAANAYRANHDLEDAYGYYKKAYEIIEICGDDSLYASYYNNMALLHQEAGKFNDAVECLKKALIIADEKMHDETRTAISRTNLATSLLRMKRADEAKEILEPAMKYFAGRTPSDFHYCATLSAMGDMYLAKADTVKASEYFEMALSEIELHMGKNNFYEIVGDNLASVYKMMGGKPKLNGIELSRKYFEAFGKPVLERNFSNILDKLAVGLFGEGSECLGFDDDISTDHDFGPGFVIIVKDEVDEKEVNRLKKAYELLPKSFMGIERITTREGANRVGVIRLKDFLKKVTGFEHLPKGPEEWQYTIDENLIMGVNGEVFMDKSGFFNDIRIYLRNEQPYYVYFKKLAIMLEKMAKHGQYSYPRALARTDMTALLIAKTEFIKSTMKACHIICKQYAPYAKWLRRSMNELKYFQDVACLIDELSVSNDTEKDMQIIENICEKIRKALVSRGLITTIDSYLAVAARELTMLANKTVVADGVVDIEWALFDKVNNEGCRATCQDDWSTFSIMRRSQYYCWPENLLKIIFTDYKEAMQKGRNVITEKYGYMMESTSPDEYKKIKDMLPAVDEDKKKIIDAIVAIQVQWMEEFAKQYPNMAKNARTIHSHEDTEYNTSYETYLRGELSTYHPDTLEAYGRYIATLEKDNVNLSKIIMNMTAFFYGFDSLEECNG